MTPFLVANFIADAASGHIAIHTGARGPNFSPTSACATGAIFIGEAFENIRRGDADTVITGSSEAVLLPRRMPPGAQCAPLPATTNTPRKHSSRST